MNSYIIRNNSNIYSVYYENNCIHQRLWKGDEWSEAKTIAVNSGKEFSLMRSSSGNPLVVYQDGSGNIMLSGDESPHKIVLRNTSEIKTKLHIDGIINDNTLRLFYNKDYINESYLVEQHRRGDGSWSNPTVLDSYIPSSNMTKLVSMENNYILFYSKKVPEQQIGYREITSYNISEFKILYATGYKISDYSLAVTTDAIHLAAVINTIRSNKLIYVRKDNTGISKSKILYDGIIKGCHISIQNSKIIIVFETSRGNSRIASFDLGQSFKKIESAEQFSFNKSVFADYTKQIADEFVACELLTNPIIPYEVKQCPFIHDNKANEIERLKSEIERLKKVAKV